MATAQAEGPARPSVRTGPQRFRVLAVTGLLLLALVAGFAASQDSNRYAGAVALICFMFLFRKWQEPYVYVVACLFFMMSSCGVEFVQAQGLSYRWHFLFLLAAVAGLRMLYEGDWTIHLTPLQIGIVLWLAYIAVTTLWSIDPADTFFRAGSLAMLAIAAFFTLWRYLNSRRRMQLFLRANLLLMIPALLLQLPFVIRGNSWEMGRFMGWTGHPNTVGMLASLGTPFVLYYLLDGATTRWERYLAGTLLISGLICTLLTRSRTATLAVGCSCLLYLLFRGWKRVAAALLALALLVGILVGYDVDLMSLPGVQELVRPENLATGAGRVDLWWIGWFFVAKNPFWGYGFVAGNLLLVDSFMQLYAPAGMFHSSYMETLVGTGFVGFLPLVLFLGLTGFRGVRGFRRSRDRWHRFLLLGLTCVFVSGLIVAGLEDVLFHVGNVTTLPWWCLVGTLCVAAAYPHRFQESGPVEGGTGPDASP
jgi:O-antigen ligase